MPGWTRVEEIFAYQRSLELRDKVLALIDGGAIPYNFHLRDQISDAARSAPANISEGFDRYKHGQFGYQVGVAKASLAELGTHLDEVGKRGFLSKKVLDDLFTLLSEAYRLTNGLLRHLETTETPPPWLKAVGRAAHEADGSSTGTSTGTEH
jgi:four helix bundle protein